MTAATQPVIVREPLGRQVANHLRDAIVRGELGAGQRLVETEIAEQLNVSRGPVRDGLRILATEGLVAKQGQGVTVLRLDDTDIEELYSLRAAIETLALGITMARAGQPDLSGLEAILLEMNDAADRGDTAAFTRADAGFHTTLCEMSGHRRATAVWRQLEPTTVALLRVTIQQDRDLRKTAAKHRLLADLIAAGDPRPALAELDAHLAGSRDRMLQAWQASQSPS